MERVRASSAPPPSSVSPCPACGKNVDTLRAGHVAMLADGFKYFCDVACKKKWAEGVRSSLEGVTAEPPSVTARPPSVIPSGVRETKTEEPPPVTMRSSVVPPEPVEVEEEEERAAFPLVEPPPDFEHEHEQDEKAEPERPRAKAPSEPPQSVVPKSKSIFSSPPKSIAPRSRPAAPKKKGAPVDWLGWAPVVGIVLGAFACVVSLAGESANATRLPLAWAAAAVVVVWGLIRPRDEEGAAPSYWVAAGPVVLGAAISAALRLESYATFVGLASAAVLACERLLSRARRELETARADTAKALTSPARVARGDQTIDVDAASIKPGEQVVVEAKEDIPVDGVVAAGTAEIAPWLESPIVSSKREGDSVVAGATVTSGRLRVTATFTGADRAWLRRVDVAAPLVVLARKNALRAAPVSALLVAGATYASNGALADVLLAGVAGSFVAASLSGASAAAIAHARGHLAAQRRGIVYKDAVAFDDAARADVAVICSRGTILLGEPEIVAIEAASSRGISTEKHEVARVLSLAAGAEMASSHPFAAAIMRAARTRGVAPENVRSALKHSGRGVTALAPNGDKVIVGNRAFLLEERVSVAIADARITELEAQGRSVLAVALGGRLAGIIALQDGLRPGARAAVHRLHDAHIEPVLLTGEARDTSETIARALDVEHVRPEILPADRGAEVRALADGGRVVAAIGHASTDDGALGAADVSVAMGAAGAAPGEWAVALASDDVRDAALALTIARICREKARVAIVIAAAAQALAALSVAFGLVSPAVIPVAAILAAFAALTAVRDAPRVH